MGYLMKFGNGHGRVSVSSELELELTRKCVCVWRQKGLFQGEKLYTKSLTIEYLTVLYYIFHFEFLNYKKCKSSEYSGKVKYCAQISLNILTCSSSSSFGGSQSIYTKDRKIME